MLHKKFMSIIDAKEEEMILLRNQLHSSQRQLNKQTAFVKRDVQQVDNSNMNKL